MLWHCVRLPVGDVQQPTNRDSSFESEGSDDCRIDAFGEMERERGNGPGAGMETVKQKTKGQIDDEHSEVGRSKGTR